MEPQPSVLPVAGSPMKSDLLRIATE